MNLTQAFAAAGVGATASGRGDEQPGRDERLLEDDYSFPSELAVGGGSTKYSSFEDPGVYLPGSGPGKGYRPATGKLTSPFLTERTYRGVTRPHLGNDFAVGDGFVYARFDGVATVNYFRREGAFGNNVVISRLHYNRQYNLYAHLAKVYVESGNRIRSGQIIGTIGGTGFGKPNHYKPHLHYAEFIIDRNRRRVYYDPGYNK